MDEVVTPRGNCLLQIHLALTALFTPSLHLQSRLLIQITECTQRHATCIDLRCTHSFVTYSFAVNRVNSFAAARAHSVKAKHHRRTLCSPKSDGDEGMLLSGWSSAPAHTGFHAGGDFAPDCSERSRIVSIMDTVHQRRSILRRRQRFSSFAYSKARFLRREYFIYERGKCSAC
jgi:hypothetical protein